jgi:hypothetical protein
VGLADTRVEPEPAVEAQRAQRVVVQRARPVVAQRVVVLPALVEVPAADTQEPLVVPRAQADSPAPATGGSGGQTTSPDGDTDAHSSRGTGGGPDGGATPVVVKLAIDANRMVYDPVRALLYASVWHDAPEPPGITRAPMVLYGPLRCGSEQESRRKRRRSGRDYDGTRSGRHARVAAYIARGEARPAYKRALPRNWR